MFSKHGGFVASLKKFQISIDHFSKTQRPNRAHISFIDTELNVSNDHFSLRIAERSTFLPKIFYSFSPAKLEILWFIFVDVGTLNR